MAVCWAELSSRECATVATDGALDKFLHRRNLWVVHVLLDEVMEGKQSELSPKKLDLYRRLSGTNAQKVLATVNSLTPVTHHGLCEGELLCDLDGRVAVVGLSLFLLPWMQRSSPLSIRKSRTLMEILQNDTGIWWKGK